MRDELETNDDVLFDRLVDGELSAAERRELLTALDILPGGWRKCALAFLEAQTWRRELTRVANEPAVPTNVARAAADDDSQIASRRAVQFLTLAASVFVAFTLGLAFGDLPHPHQSAAPSPSNSQMAASKPMSTRIVPLSPMPNGLAGVPGTGDALTLWARDESGQMRPFRVPLVDATAMDRQFGTQFRSNLSPQDRQRLEQKGYAVESKRRYAPLVLDNGRPLVVPVEDTKIVPVSSRVY